MRTLKHALPLVLFTVLFMGSATAAPVAYKIDPTHTDVIATWSHFGFSKPSLHIGGAKGTIVYDATNPQGSHVDVQLQLDTLDSHVPKLDEHLASADFFNTKSYPISRFVSTRVIPKNDKRLEIHGNLTLRGVSLPVVLHADLNGLGIHPMTKQPTVGFNATTTIKRSDFGISSMVPAISDEITVSITTEASLSPP